MSGRVSLGVAGSLGPEFLAALAPAVEAAGFDTLWVNDTPAGDALVALAAAARVTERLRLATGVLPVDRRRPAGIAAEVSRLRLPWDRLTLGIGSGAQRSGALDAVRAASADLHAAGARQVVVGALGPRMRRLAARDTDGVLLSWLPEQAAAEQAAEAHALSGAAHVALYVRTAVDPAARPRLEAETRQYAGLGAYPAHFARLGVDPLATTLPDEAAWAARIGAYTAAVDEVVLRAIVAEDTVEAYRAFADRTAPAR